jgi:diguanylate cyclase (GGDEF)-like protein
MAESKPPEPGRALLVTADEAMARQGRAELEAAGFSVRVAGTAGEAESLWSASECDVVCFDDPLPDGSVLELLRRKNARDGTLPPAVCAVPAGAEHQAAEALAAGARGYLIKDPTGAFLHLLSRVVYDAIERQRLVEENRQMADEIASRKKELLALAEEFREMTTIDGLTGLHSKRFLLEAVSTEIRRARRYGHVLSFILLGLDRFKALNEKHGREAGDAALSHVARLVRGRLRDTDVVGRKGADQFAAILPRTDESGARTAAWDIVAMIAAQPLIWKDEPIPLSTSAGVAVWREGFAAPQDLWDSAERALRRAKEEGRGRAAVDKAVETA